MTLIAFGAPQSGVQDFRFRDFRTKVQRAGRNPKPTQRAMNHADLASIFRYIAVVDEEVRTYVEATQAAQSDAQPPTADRKAG